MGFLGIILYKAREYSSGTSILEIKVKTSGTDEKTSATGVGRHVLPVCMLNSNRGFSHPTNLCRLPTLPRSLWLHLNQTLCIPTPCPFGMWVIMTFQILLYYLWISMHFLESDFSISFSMVWNPVSILLDRLPTKARETRSILLFTPEFELSCQFHSLCCYPLHDPYISVVNYEDLKFKVKENSITSREKELTRALSLKVFLIEKIRFFCFFIGDELTIKKQLNQSMGKQTH